MAKRNKAAREKRARDREALATDPQSAKAADIAAKRSRRNERAGVRRAAARLPNSSTQNVARTRNIDSDWVRRSRVLDFVARPSELFRVQPTLYGGTPTQLSFDSFGRLQHGRWLTGEVIDCYFASLGHQCTDPPGVAVVSTYFYNILETAGPGSERIARFGRRATERESNSPGLLRGRLLLVPVHWRQNHWALVSIHIPEKEIKLWDSLKDGSGMQTSDRLKELFMQWVDVEQESRGVEHNPREWSWTVVQDAPQQTNGFDCGVYTCAFALAIVQGRRCEVNDGESAQLFRAEMLYSFLLAASGK